MLVALKKLYVILHFNRWPPRFFFFFFSRILFAKVTVALEKTTFQIEGMLGFLSFADKTLIFVGTILQYAQGIPIEKKLLNQGKVPQSSHVFNFSAPP